MQVTNEKLDELMQGLKRVAMENRERAGFSGQFTPVAIIVGPDGQHVVQPTPYRSKNEKAIFMRAMSLTARQMGVLAIVLVNDTYHCNTKKLAERYGIDPKLPYKEFRKVYLEILDTQFNGSLANAPDDVKSDALIIAMKGPIVPQRIFFLPYHEGVGDSIRWDEEEPEHEGEILMLEDWWDETPVN
jgi:hypothetical protein